MIIGIGRSHSASLPAKQAPRRIRERLAEPVDLVVEMIPTHPSAVALKGSGDLKMGVFFVDQPGGGKDAIEVIKEALNTEKPATEEDAAKQAEAKAAEIAPAGYKSFSVERFFGALAIFLVIVVAAIITDLNSDLTDSSKALWGFAATIFGVVVGFLAGEKAAG